jgi:hypothetical protein
MDEARGDTKVKEAMTAVAAHLFLEDQFLGFRGSLGPSNLTCRALVS